MDSVFSFKEISAIVSLTQNIRIFYVSYVLYKIQNVFKYFKRQYGNKSIKIKIGIQVMAK